MARKLRGSAGPQRYAFPGFQALFKCNLEIAANPIVLGALDHAAMQDALTQVKTHVVDNPHTLPVLILPAADDAYLIHKALFSQAKIPTQVCTLPVLQNDASLTWAIANIALQIFCKAGGYPWKVRPAAAERTLILGISQSHKLRKVHDRTEVEKYFAFSVLTDSSGLFQELHVLGEGDEESNYLDQLRESLGRVLTESAGEFGRVVIHTSFKLKHREIGCNPEDRRARVPHPAVGRVSICGHKGQSLVAFSLVPILVQIAWCRSKRHGCD